MCRECFFASKKILPEKNNEILSLLLQQWWPLFTQYSIPSCIEELPSLL